MTTHDKTAAIAPATSEAVASTAKAPAVAAAAAPVSTASSSNAKPPSVTAIGDGASGGASANTASQPSTSSAGRDATGGTKLMISKRQESNPVLKYVRGVPYEWTREIRADFECGRNLGLLYLTLKWHKLHPDYLETRCNDLNAYQIQVLLVLNNVEEPAFMMRDLNIHCYRCGWTMIMCYTVEEAGEYIESLKLAETRNPVSTIQAIQQYKAQRHRTREPTERERNRQMFEEAIKFLCTIRAISSSDARRLLGNFGTLVAISRASTDQLAKCPGMAATKADYVYRFFRSPLVVAHTLKNSE